MMGPDQDMRLPLHSDSEDSGVPTEAGGSTGLSSVDDDVLCIVGMACHLPGHITSPADLWKFLSSNRSAQGPVPPERFNISGFYHPDGSRAGAMNVLGGYFLQEDVRKFENSFFGINNMEATYMDPQQRKLLEVVFECFEDAGVSMDTMSGSNTGVFVGNFTVDYQTMQTRDPDYMHRYMATGSGTAIMSNRISHVFNLQGPSLTLDTACSSSIYALHQAVMSIQAGDCAGAVVAGANLITAPEQHLGTMKGGVLSPTSTCHTFDISADGYGRAEGVNAIYIKPLSSAIRAGDNVRAIIRSTAINANGYTPGITLPSADLQEKVIRRAYARAGLDFADTDYVECHGTGTAVGDPIEVNALSRCFAPRDSHPLLIGSVKTNLGHSEAASGLTSIIKVVVAFEHGAIPPTHGVVNINPKLKLEERRLEVVRELQPWPRALRRASINSFGYGGANAHVILEAVDSYLRGDPDFSSSTIDPKPAEEVVVLPISAMSANSLERRRRQVAQLIPQCDPVTVYRLASTLGQRRSHLPTRQFLLAQVHAVAPAEIKEPPETVGPIGGAEALPFAFVFTGQGAQYAGMARELLEANVSFRATIRALDDVLQGLPAKHRPDWTLEESILDSAHLSRVNEVSRSQPLCTAIQIGLVDLLRSWGVHPVASVGHSSGEIAAAYVAGLLSPVQAILTAYFRGYACERLQSEGSMMAAGLDVATAQRLIEEQSLVGQVRVACVNSPESVTLSGEVAGIDALQTKLHAQSKFARRLVTGGRAYHSHLMAEIGGLYEDLLRPHLSTRSPANATPTPITMYSSVGYTDQALQVFDSSTDLDLAAYWRANLEQPVQFSAAVSHLAASGKYHLLELGPHAALKGPIKQIRTALRKGNNSMPYSATLVRDRNADLCLKALAGTLFVHGHTLKWAQVHQWGPANPSSHISASVLHDLSPYPWDYSARTPWYEPRASVEIRNRKHVRHELLGTAQLTGNGIQWSWRNILRLGEVPWLRDHQLEEQIVFPAACYLALAIEAVTQVQGLTERSPEDILFDFRHVHINEALILEDSRPEAVDRELHTTLAPARLSAANVSADWHEFTVSSWQPDGQTTTHCTGRLRVVRQPDAQQPAATVTVTERQGYDTWGMNRWYERLREEGLVFGPHFQSLTSLLTDSNRARTDAVATTQLTPPVQRRGATAYLVHPITIDACLQAAIMGSTAGTLSQLHAFMPTFITAARLRVPSRTVADAPEDVEIHTQSTATGSSLRRIDCTLRARLDGTPIIDLRGVRLAQYSGRSVTRATEPLKGPALFEQRHPCLRVEWKPDIGRLDGTVAGALQGYVANWIKRQSPDLAEMASLPVLAALVDLAGHREPRIRVLEIGSSGCHCRTRQLLAILDQHTAFPRSRSWHAGEIAANGTLSMSKEDEAVADGPFDLILVPQHGTSQSFWQHPQKVAALLSERGVLVTRTSDAARAGVHKLGWAAAELDEQVFAAVRSRQTESLRDREVLIVTSTTPSTDVLLLVEALVATDLSHLGLAQATRVSLDELQPDQISPATVIISLLELETEFLATISPADLNRLRLVTDVVHDLLWVTGANMLGGSPDPNLTLASGLSRALMLEQPSLRFKVLDIGPASALRDLEHLHTTTENLRWVLSSAPGDEKQDHEFIQSQGLLWISRFSPAEDLNTLFRQRLDPREPLALQPLATAGPARLAIGHVGSIDTLHFQQADPVTPGPPPPGYVDVALRAVSLNAKDIYAMSGRVETRGSTTALEFSGEVTAVGPDIAADRLHPGDQVVVWAPNCFGTVERVPVGCVHRLREGESLTALPALLTVHATALHALRNCAQLRAGESVLIHAGAGAFGLAAIALARQLGATVYTTVGSDQKRDYLVAEHGVPAMHIFHSRTAAFAADVRAATGGRGVDVIVNSLVGDLLHASWDCLAPFGRFVEIGKRDLVDAGQLDMSRFVTNATFTAFDLSDFFFAPDPVHRALWEELMAEVLDRYRTGLIDPGPITTFDVADVAQAYRYFHASDRVGKVVVSLEDPRSRVPVAPARYATVLSPDKVYLLVGCLGGLGRSLSRWMMARGARHFVFLGRSGCDKPSAAQLVQQLRLAGMQVAVVRGDVSVATDVAAAVAQCHEMMGGRDGVIGGVVQAAMGLHEALFTQMTPQAWHTGIDPKWQGTWNLHHALASHEQALDFFLCTSSVSGSVGTATESNYCAANGFLDAFARWRRSRGQPAVAVGFGMISEVGYLHENPEIEALLLRKGIQPLSEEEFLQVVDFALALGEGSSSDAHILTGLEGFSIRKLLAQGFDVNNGTMQDPRAAFLSASLQAEQDVRNAAVGQPSGGAVADAAPWFTAAPPSAQAMLAAAADAPSAYQAVLQLTRNRFSNLILLPPTQVDDRRPMPQYGVDSMIASEFRAWFWAAFKVDIPFLTIMSSQTALATLAELVETKLIESWKDT